jgi:hypothetical protein
MSTYFKCYKHETNKWIQYPCDDISNESNTATIYFKVGLTCLILIVFFLLIRPTFLYFVYKCLNINTNDTYSRSREHKEIQCCIDSNLQKIVINPDDSYNLLEDTCMKI